MSWSAGDFGKPQWFKDSPLAYRLWRWGAPMGAIALITGAGWFLWQVWEWVLR